MLTWNVFDDDIPAPTGGCLVDNAHKNRSTSDQPPHLQDCFFSRSVAHSLLLATVLSKCPNDTTTSVRQRQPRLRSELRATFDATSPATAPSIRQSTPMSTSSSMARRREATSCVGVFIQERLLPFCFGYLVWPNQGPRSIFLAVRGLSRDREMYR